VGILFHKLPSHAGTAGLGLGRRSVYRRGSAGAEGRRIRFTSATPATEPELRAYLQAAETGLKGMGESEEFTLLGDVFTECKH